MPTSRHRVALTTIVAAVASSACTTGASAKCDLGGQQLSASAIRRFGDEPKSLIKAEIVSPRDTAEFARKTGQLALTGSRALQVILQLVSTASDKQKSAIAVGLHNIVSTCRHTDPVAVARTTRSIALISDRVFKRAYAKLDDTTLSGRNIRAVGDGATNGTLPAVSPSQAEANLPVAPGGAGKIADPFAPVPLTDPFAPL